MGKLSKWKQLLPLLLLNVVNHWENPDSVLSGKCLCNIPKPSYSGVCTRCNRIVHLTENWAEASKATEVKPVRKKSNHKKNSTSLGNKYCTECKLPYKKTSSFCSICGTKLLDEISQYKIYCENCGKLIPKNGKKCLSCGANIAVNLDSTGKEVDSDESERNWTAKKYHPLSKTKSASKIILWLVVLSGIAVIFFVSSNGNSNDPNSGSGGSSSSTGHNVWTCRSVENPNYVDLEGVNGFLHGPSKFINQCQWIWVSN
jgi:rRNA maturation endonuclease Nob1